MKKLIVFYLLFFPIGPVFGHQPRIVNDIGTFENPIKIEKPEISKAYYAVLKGAPDYYEINSETDFNLYLNMLVPDLEGIRTDFFVEVFFEGVVSFTLRSDEWEKFFEPFGGDNYLIGPEFDNTTNKGSYLIRVSNPDNVGKYVLAVGKIESFPLKEILKTLIVLPKLKQEFFEKSPFTAYFNYSGLFLIFVISFLAAIIYIIVRLIRKKQIH